MRQSQRDRETAEAFEPLRPAAHRLLATARTQLTALPTTRAHKGWAWQLTTLHYALERLDALHQEWSRTRRHLPVGAVPGTDVYDDALAEHHAEAWSYLDDWATHGQAVLDIHAAARDAPSPLAPAPAAVQTANRAATPRR